MTSKNHRLVVFTYLPGNEHAYPAGVLRMISDGTSTLTSEFVYGKRYTQRAGAMAVDPIALALPSVAGAVLRPPNGLIEFGAFRDSAPDMWGRRVIENKLRRTGPLPEADYLLHAGAQRVGALDFRSTDKSEEAGASALRRTDLEHLRRTVELIESGEPVPPSLERCLDPGTSMGGARPKMVLEADDRLWLAKFSSSTDMLDIPAVERATLELARQAGLRVPETRLERLNNGQHAMLIERFDRAKGASGWLRSHFVSALTLVGAHELDRCSYLDIAESMRKHLGIAHLATDLAELFARMVFNIFVSNDDDHLRNHGFTLTPEGWRLAPLYDVVPRPSSAFERTLNLGLGVQGRAANLPNAMSKHGVFGLSEAAATDIIDRIAAVVRQWKNCFEAHDVPARSVEAVASAIRRHADIS